MRALLQVESLHAQDCRAQDCRAGDALNPDHRKISSRGASRLKAGHVWVYRSDVLSADGIPPGSLVRVTDERGKFYGSALYSSTSQIAIRLLSSAPITDVPALIKKRIEDAISYRERYVRETDAYRLVFSEADFLPGLIADRFNDVISLQILTQAMDAPSSREAILATLSEKLRPSSIVERVDPHIRELEQLPPRESQPVGRQDQHLVTMNGIKFHYEALAGRRPDRFSISAKLRGAAGYAHTATRSTFFATRADSPCTSRRTPKCHRRRQLSTGTRGSRAERDPQRPRDRMDRSERV